MKKLLSIILCCTIVLSLVGCGASSDVYVNTENTGNLTILDFGESAMREIGNGLFYDSTTRIVYWWNGTLAWIDFATTPSPYYAPNGLPYRYNPETYTFEEIHHGECTDTGDR